MPISQDYSSFLAQLNSAKFRNLWPAQEHVLREYAQTYSSNNDVAIELPTGAGKTLIILLIAEAWRQEGNKVAVLSANKTLARQMLRESQALGIPATLMEGSREEISSREIRAYQRFQKVAIMNYWVYFNQNPAMDPADVIFMDDAHLAEHALQSLYSVEIDRFTHEGLFNSIVAELADRFPEYSVLTDALSGYSGSNYPTELLSFIDQVIFEGRFREIVDESPYLQSDQSLNFRWQRIRHQLREANVYLGLNSLWIRPYIYPLVSNDYYRTAKQRLYMSATIGEPSDLSRQLGVREIQKIPVPIEYAERTSGRRLVIMNRIEDADLPARLQRIIFSALQIQPKSVWLCASRADASRYRSIISQWLENNGLANQSTWILTPLGDEIDQFKTAAAGHLFVGGRFDGMDFSAQECRLVVVTTLPRAINLQEDFIASYLRDSGFMKRRLNQRVVQALGRCNRSPEDFGVYVLADRRFATHFGPEGNKVGVPRNIIAEIDMAQDLAEEDITTVIARVREFLNGEFEQYDTDYSNYESDVPVQLDIPSTGETSNDEVIGWTALFESKNYEVASERFEQCWNISRTNNLIEIAGLHGWHWSKALYLQSLLAQPSLRDRALQVLDEAVRRGGRSAWFNRMRASLSRARQAPDLLQSMRQNAYSDHLIMTFDELLENEWSGNRFERWRNTVDTNLQSEDHDQYQRGLEDLGRALGYQSVQPRHQGATDCRWRGIFGNQREVITFEAKVEHQPSNELSYRDVGQANNQYNRARQDFERQGFIVRSAIVSHLTVIAPEAESSLGEIRVIRKEAIFALWQRLGLILSTYRSQWSSDNLNTRLIAADNIRGRLPMSGWLIRSLSKETIFIEAEDLLEGWEQI